MIHPWNLGLFRQLGTDPEHMPHAVLLEIFTDVGIGTEITK